MYAGSLATDDMAWYAIRTRSRHENVVRTQLARKRIEAFLPTVMRWSRWKDRRAKIDWPLFPGYCFARFQVRDLLEIRTCTGVAGIVSFEGRPAPVDEQELDNLRRALSTTLPCDPCPMIREGTIVDVIGGPLSGVTGRLIRKDGAHATVVLSVHVINQAVRVEVDAADISPH